MKNKTKKVTKSKAKCQTCSGPVEFVRKGSDMWKVHVSTGKAACPDTFTGCPVASAVHMLADGTPCPDPRHDN